MSVKLRHVGIVVKNLPEATAFYRDLLGFELHKEALESGSFIDKILGNPNTRVTTVKLIAPDNSMVELLHFEASNESETMSEKGLFERGLTHIALTVTDLAQLYAKLSKVGIRFISEPTISADGFAKVAFCQDPEGTFLELVQPLN